MLLSKNSPEFDHYIIFLDGKVVRAVLEANDTEGWVTIPDIKFPPIETTNSKIECTDSKEITGWEDLPAGETSTEWEELKVITKFGKVEFRKIP